MRYRKGAIRKVLVPVIPGCESSSAVAAGIGIAGGGRVLLVGLAPVHTNRPVEDIRKDIRWIRRQFIRYTRHSKVAFKRQVLQSAKIWQDLVEFAELENVDLLVLEWPGHVQALGLFLSDPKLALPCELAVVRAPIAEKPSRILVSLRGGANAELALRLSLSMARHTGARVTSLHLTGPVHQPAPGKQLEPAYRVIEQVLVDMPEVDRQVKEAEDTAEAILLNASDYDLLFVGASTRFDPAGAPLSVLSERIMQDSPCGVMVVRAKSGPSAAAEDERVGQRTISILVDQWFAESTYYADDFANLHALVSLKQAQGLTISLALPALNEEKTVGEVIGMIKRALMDEVPLLDEMVLMDSNSTDCTRKIAESLGVPVYIHQEVLPRYGARRGKGEALWKSLYVTNGDLLVWIDTDIVNIHPRFVYGLLGPLLADAKTLFVKGFYRRPLRVGNRIQAGGGGRVTELTARPLFNLFYPQLSGIIQPLSGEYGGRRTALETMPFFSGYGVETGLLIDVLEKYGLHAIAQVDLLERIHHNQPLESLSKMSFAIIQAVIQKLEKRLGHGFLDEVNKSMKLIRYEPGRFYLDVEQIAELERPAMVTIPEYLEKRSN